MTTNQTTIPTPAPTPPAQTAPVTVPTPIPAAAPPPPTVSATVPTAPATAPVGPPNVPPNPLVGQTIMKKPVIWTNGRILNLDSGFKHKHLCTGPTFTAGTACVYKCVYCYVKAIVGTKPFVTNVLGGQNFQNVVIRRNDAVNKLKSELYAANGKPKYKYETGVVYGSPLVDIAPNVELADERLKL